MVERDPERPSNRYGRSLVLAGDHAGAAVFAAEGSLIAVAARLDLLGVAVLAFVTALGGGIIRDLVLGAAPPAALQDWRYPFAVLVGMLTALFSIGLERGSLADMLLVLDAAGLGLFTAAGTQKALDRGSPAYAAIMLGTITATAGGALRDVLLAEVPSVLRIDFYATAAMVGALVMVAVRRLGVRPQLAAVAGGLSCVFLRLLGVLLHWHLPIPG